MNERRENPLRQRNVDLYPWTWEVPVGLGAGLGVLVVMSAQVGRSLALLMSGQGLELAGTDCWLELVAE